MTGNCRKRIAILCGISDYPRTMGGKLPSVSKEIDALEHALKNALHESYKYEVIPYKDAQVQLEDFPRIFAPYKVNSEIDELLFYFGGHGKKIDDEAYFVSHGTKDNEHGIALRALAQELNSLHPSIKRIFAIFDFCFSGSIFGDINVTIPFSERVAILTATRKDQLAEVPKDGKSFAQHFIDGLTNALPDKDGEISFGMLAHYIKNQMKDNFVQSPSFLSIGDVAINKINTKFLASPLSPNNAFNKPMADNSPLQINLNQDLISQFAQLAQLVTQAVANPQPQTSVPTIPLPPPDSPPSIFPGSVRRERIVNFLYTELSKVTWLNVKGATGIGKSFIAGLITIKHGASNTVWISLRGERNKEEILLSLLNGHLLRIASTSENNLNQTYTAGKLSFTELAKKAATVLSHETMLVIDEVPDLAKNILLAKKIAELSVAIREVGGKFLTTSQRSLPSNIFLEFSHIGISEKDVVAMSVEDVIAMLRGLDAPLTVIEENYPQLILEKTNGQPFLTLAIASYMRDCKWIINEEVLDSIDKGVPIRKIGDEILHTISQLLPNENVRDLLYRLSLMETSFDTSLVRELAELSQTIPRPMELFPELVGPWVNQLMENHFEISPLIRNIGKRILDPKQQEEAHFIVARYYLYKGGMDQYLAFQVIRHLVLADNWHLLVTILLQFAYQVTKKEHAKAFEPIIEYLDRTELTDVLGFVRIAIYTTKLLIHSLVDKPTGDLLVVLDRQLQELKKTDMDEYTLLTVFSVEILLMQPHNPTLSAGAVAKTMLQVCQTAQKLGSLPVPLKISKGLLQQFMWMGVRRISTRTDIREILMVLKELSPTELKAVFSDKLMRVSPNIFVDMCWELELRKEDSKQDWDGALKLLEEISEVAEMPGAESLKPLVGHAKAVVLADYMNQLTQAIEVIDSLLPTSDSDGRFILNQTAGNCFIQKGKFEDALSRYQMALADFTDVNQNLYFDVLRRASQAAGKIGKFELMRDLAIRALRCKKLYRNKTNV